MISSLTNQGKLRFMVYSGSHRASAMGTRDGALNATIFLRFLQRLVNGAERKLFVIVGDRRSATGHNLRVHRAKRVTAWLRANAARIELFYLPPYAPEHNPDEFLNNDVKQTMARQNIPRDKASLKSGLTSYMRGLQRRPAKLRAFFQAPTVRYAA
jgi:transposase